MEIEKWRNQEKEVINNYIYLLQCYLDGKRVERRSKEGGNWAHAPFCEFKEINKSKFDFRICNITFKNYDQSTAFGLLCTDVYPKDEIPCEESRYHVIGIGTDFIILLKNGTEDGEVRLSYQGFRDMYTDCQGHQCAQWFYKYEEVYLDY